MRRSLLVLPALLSLVGCASFAPSPAKSAAPATGTLDVKLIAFNDFHGNLRQPGSGVKVPDPADPNKTLTVPAGGSEYLATWIKQLKAKNPHHAVVSAGDLIGASPLLSSLFHDEPTIESMNEMGLEFNAVGNHEFDEGAEELLRMQRGGCHPKDGCKIGDFNGARFKFLAANVIERSTGKPLFPAYQIKRFEGVPVAFIGMTLKDTPTIVNPSGVAGLQFLDEAETVNRLVPELKAQGVRAIVVLVHEGGVQTPDGGINDCKGISGAIVDIVKRFDPEVDVVVSGHTHQPYNCAMDNRLLTSAYSYGRLVTEIDLKLDRASGDVIERRANNLIVATNVNKDANQTALLERVSKLVAPLEGRIIGTIGGALTNQADRNGETTAGRFIADAQLEATRDPKLGGAQIAFMNDGGVRGDIVPDAQGRVTFGQLFTAQPWGNNMMTVTLKGSDIVELLEQQFRPKLGVMMFVSENFTYRYDLRQPEGQRVLRDSIHLNGAPLDLNADYRVAANSFLALGGNNFSVFLRGRNPVGGPLDVDALIEYVERQPGRPVPTTPRANKVE
ncbi:bifunctional metallophosphatase/5'-nucleotidase [Chitinimonas lacunae]|uniref:Bifunctional metallophosphatase/5'-nucleotidase n=1 Tax=Chitinimonas lacunae TaxID=1963018 RepID=A0ABV8MK84_9NEIS